MKAIFKKLLFVCFGIVFAMLVSFGASAAAIPGDVNGDSEVNIRDAAAVLMYINNMPVECVNEAIDTNGDGKINTEDVKSLLGNITGHNNTELKTGDACEHELTYVEGKERGTCPESGLSEHWVCSKCSKIFKDENATILTNTAGVTIEPIHISGEWKEEVPATKTENGLKTIRCTVCDKLLESEDIPATGSIGLAFTLNEDGQSYSVSGIGTCTDTEVVIPATYNGLPVTSIGSQAFIDCSSINSIAIPNSVTTIGENAFFNCSSLTNITIPNSVTSIGNQAFFNCSSLTNINIPIGVTRIGNATFARCFGLESIVVDSGNTVYHSYNNCLIETASKTLIAGCKNSVIPTDGSVTSIGNYAFYYCSGLENIIIPNGVTSIGNYAFYYCSGLENIIIPNGVTSIGAYAFFDCSNLISVIIPNSVIIIGDYAFSDCSSLTSITIPNSVTSIGHLAFRYCSGLESIVVEPGNTFYHSYDNCLIETASKTLIAGCKNSVIPTDGSVTSIGNYAFSSCLPLTIINIPDSITSIGNYAFYYCLNLTIINIPNSVISIGDCAFSYCLSLRSINIPNSVTSIENYAFNNCKYLSTFIFDGSAEEWKKVEKGVDWNKSCPFTEVFFTQTNASQGLEFTLNYNGQSYSVSGIGTCTDTEIIIPAIYEGLPVTRIGNSAFGYGSSLTSITIPDSVTSIGNYAFYGCSSLKSINMPNSATSIGEYAFYGCSSLTSITIPNDVTSIGDYAFFGCSSLASITIPDGVTSIGEGAFSDCLNLTSINISNGVTSIGSYAFAGCSSLTSVTVSNSVASIGNSAFFYCENLSTFIFDGTREEWKKVEKGEGWNYRCPFTEVKFTKVSASQGLEFTLNEDGQSYSVSGIGTCTDTDIVIPSTYEGLPVTKIGNYAFEYCRKLISITIPDSVTSIGNYAFYCSSLTSINIPNSVISIGNYAFYSSSLTSINIPNSVTSIGEYAFIACSNLTSITIPNSVTSIGDFAFKQCSNLTSITISNSVTSIGEGVFDFCPKLESIVVEEGNTVYHSYNNCLIETASKTLILGCKNSVIPTDGSVTSIGSYAFHSCHSLTSINIPNRVTSIEEGAFFDCSSLTSISIPNSVTSIGAFAFDSCSSLTSISIPNSVTSIGAYAFSYCTNLSSFTFDGTAEEWVKVKKGTNWHYDCPFTEVIFTKETHIHDLVHVEAKTPSCTENGNIEYWYCSECDWMELEGGIATNKKAVTLPASHNLKIVMTQNASCTRPGLVVQECSVCKSVIYDTLDMLPHTESDWITDIEPTDTKDGHRYKSCTVCGQTVASEIILRPGATEHEHVPEIIPGIEATCTVSGMTEGQRCVVCLEILVPQQEIPGGHMYWDEIVIEATCTNTGLKIRSCTVCGEQSTITLAMRSHKKGSWITVIEPTDNKDGYRHRVCTVCGQVVAGEVILRPGATEHEHSIVIDPAVEANCLPGKTEGKYCEICGEVIVSQEEIPPSTTHDYVLVSTIAPSCKTEGYQYFYCQYCGGAKINALPITDHGFSEWTIVQPTSTKDGYKTRTCIYCELVEKIILEATGSVGLEYSLNEDRQSYSVVGIGTCTDTEIVIPSTYQDKPVTGIGANAFNRCENITEVIIPNGVTNIGAQAFAFCFSLTNVTIPDSITSIGGQAFGYCSELKTIKIPAGLTSIGGRAFALCTGLTSINIPEGVKVIEAFAFESCVSVTSVTIPNSVTEIHEYAFENCSNLKSISIPKSVRNIRSGILNGCSNLESITVEEGNSVYHSNENCLIETDSKILRFGCQNSVIPSDGSVTTIGAFAFYGCSNLTSITIPDSIMSMDIYAFSGCNNLTSIVISNSMSSISGAAFSGCENLTSVVIPTSVNHIDNMAFEGCGNLKNFIMPDSIESIGDSVFEWCYNLQSITISGNITSIGNSVFYNCNALYDVYFNGTVSEWSAVAKGNSWKDGAHFTIVHCTDGDVSVN